MDLPRRTHQILKTVAVQHDTSIQALVAAAIIRRYPELNNPAIQPGDRVGGEPESRIKPPLGLSD